jgi:hypothetical protein
MEFNEIWYWGVSLNTNDKLKFWLKRKKIMKGHFTRRLNSVPERELVLNPHLPPNNMGESSGGISQDNIISDQDRFQLVRPIKNHQSFTTLTSLESLAEGKDQIFENTPEFLRTLYDLKCMGTPGT